MSDVSSPHSEVSNLKCQVLIHGGAFVFLLDGERATQYEQSLARIIKDVESFVSNSPWRSGGLNAIDVVEYAVQLLESDPLYNAGKGSVFSSASTHVMEASLMDGANRRCGAASLIETVEHPISLARVVMERTPHNYIAGREATEKLASEHGLSIVDDNSFFSTSRRLEQYNACLQAKEIAQENTLAASKEDENPPLKPSPQDVLSNGRKGTVGCVVYLNGQVAAGTSTGGMTNKHPGRVGDSPLIGCGTYAENRVCAVSFTGTGEEIMRHVGAYDIACRMKYGQEMIDKAVHQTLFDYMPSDTAGVIAVDGDGIGVMKWNTKGMLRGSLAISFRENVSSDVDKEVSGYIGVYDDNVPLQFS